MIMRGFPRDLTPEDRVTPARWVRYLAIFSGCAVLLLLGLVLALGIPGDDFASITKSPAGIAAPAGSVAAGGRPNVPTP